MSSVALAEEGEVWVRARTTDRPQVLSLTLYPRLASPMLGEELNK